jgi:hypothetical protein
MSDPRDEKKRWEILNDLLDSHNEECRRRDDHRRDVLDELDRLKRQIVDRLETVEQSIEEIPAQCLAYTERAAWALRIARHEALAAGVPNEPAPLPLPPRPGSGTFPVESPDPTRPFSLRHGDGTYVRLEPLLKGAWWAVRHVGPWFLTAGTMAWTWFKHGH